MIEFVYDFAHTKWAKWLIGGVIGSVINRLKNKMSIKEFIANVIISAFVGIVTGVLVTNYTTVSQEVAHVIVAVAGSMSKHLYNELEQLLKGVSNIVLAFLKKKTDNV